MGVTAIKSIKNNNATGAYYIKNLEHPSDTNGPDGPMKAAPGQNITCNMWIPWCTSQTDFYNNHRIIIVPFSNDPHAVTLTIWQQGDYVRYSRDGGFHDNGTLVPGNSTVNGDRSIEITGTNVLDVDLRFY